MREFPVPKEIFYNQKGQAWGSYEEERDFREAIIKDIEDNRKMIRINVLANIILGMTVLVLFISLMIR